MKKLMKRNIQNGFKEDKKMTGLLMMVSDESYYCSAFN